VIKLSSVLGCPFFLVDVGFGMGPDLIECESPIVVEKIDGVLIWLKRIFWDH